eukprot:COSAG03_NODE_970_length_5151_cov_637.110451_6_plen_152_part_00
MLAASLAAPKGAQNLARDSVISGYAFVSGSTKWNRRFLVVTKEEMDMTAQNPDGLLLHRYTLDTDTQPLQSVPLLLETCAVEKVSLSLSLSLSLSASDKTVRSRRSTADQAQRGARPSPCSPAIHLAFIRYKPDICLSVSLPLCVSLALAV